MNLTSGSAYNLCLEALHNAFGPTARRRQLFQRADYLIPYINRSGSELALREAIAIHRRRQAQCNAERDSLYPESKSIPTHSQYFWENKLNNTRLKILVEVRLLRLRREAEANGKLIELSKRKRS